MEMKNMIVGQSGGPTAAINSSLYGVVSEGLRQKEFIGRVYGMVNGIEGFLEGHILDFEDALPGGTLEGLKTTPGLEALPDMWPPLCGKSSLTPMFMRKNQ